jgi:hypothetical protein
VIAYTRAADAVTSTDDGPTLVVLRSTGNCIQLSDTAAFLWDRLATPHTIKDLAAAATSSFTADPDMVSDQIERFVDALVRRHLLTPVGEGTQASKLH